MKIMMWLGLVLDIRQSMIKFEKALYPQYQLVIQTIGIMYHNNMVYYCSDRDERKHALKR